MIPRRLALQTLGTGAATALAGCRVGYRGGGRRVSLVATDDPPDLPVRPEVAFVEPWVTPDHPATLGATVTNVADGVVEVGEERAIVFAHVASADRRLVFLPRNGREGFPRAADCWRLREAVAVPEYYGIVRLERGERYRKEVDLWGAPPSDDDDDDGPPECLPPGEYRFETTYSAAVGEGNFDEARSASWGFTLAVSR